MDLETDLPQPWLAGRGHVRDCCEKERESASFFEAHVRFGCGCCVRVQPRRVHRQAIAEC